MIAVKHAADSARILVPDGHLARRQMEFHGAEKCVCLLILGNARGRPQVDLLLREASFFLLHLEDAAKALTHHEDGKRSPAAGT